MSNPKVDVPSSIQFYNSSPLYAACCQGHANIVEYLIKDNRIDINECMPFYNACLHGHLEVVKVLMRDHRLDVNKATEVGTPLFVAMNYLQIMELLIQDGRVDVNKPNNFGQTPIMQNTRRHECLGLVLSSGRNVDIDRRTTVRSYTGIEAGSSIEDILTSILFSFFSFSLVLFFSFHFLFFFFFSFFSFFFFLFFFLFFLFFFSFFLFFFFSFSFLFSFNLYRYHQHTASPTETFICPKPSTFDKLQK